MQYTRLGEDFVLKLEIGEEVVGELTEFVESRNIEAGMISGIGAVRDATLGYFDPDSKEYHKERLDGSFEVASLSGTISRFEGKALLHLHAVLADGRHDAKAGHLFEATVSVTLEVCVRVLPGVLERSRDQVTGLNLLDLDDRADS
jgi:hypothetical protein